MKGNRCDEARKEFRTAQSKFSDACKQNGALLGAFGASVGGVKNTCEANLIVCRECAGGESTYQGLDCGELTEKEEGDSPNPLLFGNATSALQGQGLPRERAELEALTCIPESAEELTELRKSTRDLKKDFRRSQDDLSNLQTKISEIENEGRTKENELRDREEQASERSKDNMTKISRNFENAQNEISGQIQKLQQDWEAAEDAAKQIDEQKVQAELAYSDAVRGLQTQCHAAALNQVADLRKQDMAAWQANNLTEGGLNKTMRKVGATTKQKYNDKAREFYNDCVSDDLYRITKRDLSNRKLAAIQSADNRLSTLRQKQSNIAKSANELQTKYLQQARDRATKDLQQQSEKLNQELTRVDRERNSARAENMAKLMAKRAEYDRASLNVNEDRQDYDYELTRQKAIQRKFKGKKSPKEGSFAAAGAAYADFATKGDAAYNACCPGKGATTDECEAFCTESTTIDACKPILTKRRNAPSNANPGQGAPVSESQSNRPQRRK